MGPIRTGNPDGRPSFQKCMTMPFKAFLFGFLVSLATSTVSAKTADLADPDDVERYVDGIIEAQREAYHAVGASVAVVKDGKVILAKGYGLSDRETGRTVSGAESMFRAASITKTFTATAIMQLIEQGKIDLDRDVNAYLDFALPDFKGKPVTVRNLLSHTAGFEDKYIGFFTYFSDEAQTPLCKLLAQNQPRRIWGPGEKTSYSNYGYSLLGCVIEKASGMPYADYMQNHIFRPLGMTHSSLLQPLPAEYEKFSSYGYLFQGGGYVRNGFEHVLLAPGGALSTSAGDMARYMIAHLEGGQVEGRRILSSSAMERMHQPLFRNVPGMNGIAFGFYQQTYNGWPVLAHGGNLDASHSNMVLVPRARAGFFVVYNGPAGRKARDEFTRLMMNRYFPAVAESRVAEERAYALSAADFVGRYRSNRHNYSGIEKINALDLEADIRALDARTILKSESGGQTTWQQSGDRSFRRIDANGLSDDVLRFGDGVNQGWLFQDNIPIFAAYKLAWYEYRAAYVAVGILAMLASVLSVLGFFFVKKTITRSMVGGAGAMNLVWLALFLKSRPVLDSAPFTLPAIVKVSTASLWIAGALTALAIVTLLVRVLKGRANPMQFVPEFSILAVFLLFYGYIHSLNMFCIHCS